MVQFSILTLCTGNVCRSPLAAVLLRHQLQDLDISVHSAGTHALVGHQMPEPQLAIAHQLGIEDAAAHRAKQLTLEHVQTADLVLALSREHRSAAVELTPKVLRKTFTLRELARIAQFVPDTELHHDGTASCESTLVGAVEIAAMNRGLALPAAFPEDDDVIDPYRRSQETYLKARDELVAAVDTVAEFLHRAVAWRST